MTYILIVQSYNMPPSWTASRQEVEQKKLASSAGWIPYPALKEKRSWTAGRQELEQKKLASSARWIPYSAVKVDKI